MSTITTLPECSGGCWGARRRVDGPSTGLTVAPIAVVAGLRETSVLFGAAIAVVVLREPLRVTRVAAALLIGLGLALIRLH